MYYPGLKDKNNNRSMIDTWLGYNHNYKIGMGEFFDEENLCTDNFPLLSPRKKRYRLDLGKYRGIKLVDNDIYVLEGTNLVKKGADDTIIDLSEYLDDEESEQTLLVMGGYMIFHPANVYINLNDYSEIGYMGSVYDSGTENVSVTYTPCTVEGGQLTNLKTQKTEPENASAGDYWICTDPDKMGLYIYVGYLSMWQPVAVSYIKIQADIDFASYFSVGDAVLMNTKYEDINSGSVITSIGDDYIIVIGLMDKATDSETKPFRFERKIPKMDYVCVDKNRLWGCHYGYDSSAHKVINEIYASKLGDFKNFYVYQGLTTDSYAVTVGDLGDFTGCISYQGCPIFFKENKIYKIYGSYPSEYSVSDTNVEGVQKGSSKSLAIIGEYLLYKGNDHVLIYDGSYPTSISDALGKSRKLYEGIAGSCMSKYYLACERFLFVYDTDTGIWHKEDYIPILQFSESVNGQLYAVTGDTLIGLGDTNNEIYLRENKLDEEWVVWNATSGEMGFETPDYKFVSRITLRAFIPTRSEVQIEISHDDAPYEPIGTFRGKSDIATQSLAFAPFRCDHFKLRLSGHGDCRIYSLAITFDVESEEDATY